MIFFPFQKCNLKANNNRIKKKYRKNRKDGDESTSGIKRLKLQKPQKLGVINIHYGIKTT